MSAPTCTNGSSGSQLDGELSELVPKIATAYLEGNTVVVQAHSDPERLPRVRVKDDRLSVQTPRACGTWGNKKLAFATVTATYDAENTLGQAQILLIFRKPSAQWQLLVAARDPVTNGEFATHVPAVAALLNDHETSVVPAAAALLSPPAGQSPRAEAGQRFGVFRWRSSPSDTVIAELVEFAYHDDARIFARSPVRAGGRDSAAFNLIRLPKLLPKTA
jgi:hypothetical protein